MDSTYFGFTNFVHCLRKGELVALIGVCFIYLFIHEDGM